MKVLIITYYWPPAGGSGVQRWLKFVKYLPDFGVVPVVYTAEDPQYAVTDMSLGKEVSADLEILRGKIWEPNAILERFGGSQKKVSAGFLDSKPSPAARAMRFVRANYFIPDARKFWIGPSVRFLTSYLKENEIDVLITTGPPHSVHLIGLALKRKLGLKWIADFRDPWTSIDYFHRLPLTKRSVARHKKLEREVLQTADRVIVVGRQMKEEFLPFNEEVHVIPNGYDTSEAEEKTRLDMEFTLTYAGLMNADRNPKYLWKVLGKLIRSDSAFASDLKLRFVGSCSKEVLDSLEKFGLTSKTEHLGYLDHEEVSKYQRSSQALLLTVNRVPSARGIVTGKIFEYMQARRPVLAIGPTDGDLALVMDQTRCGTICDFKDEEGIEEAVKDLYNKYRSGSLRVDSEGIEKYHRRNLTGELFEMLKEM